MTTTTSSRLLLTVLAAVLHLAALPVYASSGLLAPGWAVLCLLALWVGLAVLLWRLRGRPGALLVPAAAVALWFLVLTAGERLLGWTG